MSLYLLPSSFYIALKNCLAKTSPESMRMKSKRSCASWRHKEDDFFFLILAFLNSRPACLLKFESCLPFEGYKFCVRETCPSPSPKWSAWARAGEASKNFAVIWHDIQNRCHVVDSCNVAPRLDLSVGPLTKASRLTMNLLLVAIKLTDNNYN